MRQWVGIIGLGMLGAGMLAMAGGAQAACPATPSAIGAMEAYPGREKVPTGNDLIQSAGKPVAAEGQVVRLEGRLTDSQCRPVANAVIDLWQANREGIHRIADRAAMATPYATFAGAGRTVTDNAGRFAFTTIFPGAYQDSKGPRAPHLHLLVRHAAFPQLATELFFEDDQRNAGDPVLRMLGTARGEQLMLRVAPQSDGTLTANIDLALSGAEPFKQ